MNERIRELAQKAQVGSAEFGNGINYFVSTEETFNKFAELIVRECISRIEGCAVETSPDDFVKGYNKGVSKVSSQVKQHFGVEE